MAISRGFAEDVNTNDIQSVRYALVDIISIDPSGKELKEMQQYAEAK